MSRRHVKDDYDHAEDLERRELKKERQVIDYELDKRDQLLRVCECSHTRGQHQAIGLCLFCRCRAFTEKAP